MSARVLVIAGTRPEAIKLAPVILVLRARGVPLALLASGQHGALLDEAFAAFGIAPDRRLPAVTGDGGLTGITAQLLDGCARTIAELRPALTIVHGDTLTTLAGALASAQAGVPVAHVEAGLRTHASEPFPEEMNRRLVAGIAALHFAPTPRARDNLLGERVTPAAITVTGNTVVDALRLIAARIDWAALDATADARWALAGKRIVLATAHRRELTPARIEGIARALRVVAATPDVAMLLPVHPNPRVADPLRASLADAPGVRLCEALPYPMFLALLRRAALAITDSGGAQEEAPSFGTPVLVTRATTERPEAVEAGLATVTGYDPETIVTAARALLQGGPRGSTVNPFGDGHAAGRICDRLLTYLSAHDADNRV